MAFKKNWQKIGRIVYLLVGATGVYSLVYFLITINSFFDTMGIIPGIAYLLLTIGGLNWLVKGIFNKDLFLN
jgi:uncharacterized membrane protein YuzA (DUF378 family)